MKTKETPRLKSCKIIRKFLSFEHKVNDLDIVGVAEQIHLLALTARHLYMDEQSKPWFDRYHELEQTLLAEEALLKEYFSGVFGESDGRSCEEHVRDVLIGVFAPMDDGKSGLDCLIEAKLAVNKNTSPRYGADNWSPILQVIQTEIEAKGFPQPISAEKRLGYRHHNLFVALKYYDDVVQPFSAYQFDIKKIVAEAVFYYWQATEDTRFFSAQLAEDIARDYVNFDTYSTNINMVYENIEQIVRSINEQLDDLDDKQVKYLYDKLFEAHYYHLATTTETVLKPFWAANLLVPFDWRFQTLESEDKPLLRRSSGHDCQINIDRQELLNLIKSNQLDYALSKLGRCLYHSYHNQAADSLGKEEQSTKYSNNPAYYNFARLEKAQSMFNFVHWSHQVRVLFTQERKPPTIEAIVDAIRCYDMKNGIFNQPKQKLQDAADAIHQTYLDTDPDAKGKSAVSIKRNYAKIKKLIEAQVIDLVKEQKDLTKQSHSAGAGRILKPLWDNP